MNFLISFVVFSLVLNGFASANLIQDSCRKAVGRDNYDSCVRYLTQDPQSRTATTFEGLVVASIKSAMAKAMNVKGSAEKFLKDKRFQGIHMELQGCVEFYDDARDSMNDALAEIQAHLYKDVNINLSAAYDSPINCEDQIKERKKQKSPITNENNILAEMISIPLAFSLMLK